MPLTIKVNGTTLSLVHKMSGGISTATLPDVCKTPSPGGPVPLPYPNIAQAVTLSNGTTTVKGDKMMAANKGSKFALSMGDQPGSIGGVKSNVFMKEATWISYAFTVRMNGKNACRLTDKMFHNAENAANLTGVVQPPLTYTELEAAVGADLAKEICDSFCKAKTEKAAADQAGKKGEEAKYTHYFQKSMDAKNKPGVATEQWYNLPRGGSPSLLTPSEFTRLANNVRASPWQFNMLRRFLNPGQLVATAGGSVGMMAGVAMAKMMKAVNAGTYTGHCCRPDLTVTQNGKTKAFELKFPGDTERPNQAADYKRIDHEGKFRKVDSSTCSC